MGLLPASRYSNDFCTPNTFRSKRLRNLNERYGFQNAWFVHDARAQIQATRSITELKELMQGKGQESRRVLWNFENLLEGGSGSLEFRGGRTLRGPARTKRWICFTLAFVAVAINVSLSSSPSDSTASDSQHRLYTCRQYTGQSLMLCEYGGTVFGAMRKTVGCSIYLKATKIWINPNVRISNSPNPKKFTKSSCYIRG